jgi:hypothetical protein
MTTELSGDELFARVEQARRDEWDAMQPDLEKFRASDQELRMKLQEEASYLACVEQSKLLQPEMAKLLLWGEDIAIQAREGVRFQFWRYPHIYSK